jgi:selenophosphate synthetase-related protein
MMVTYDIDWIRELFLDFDKMSKPIMGIKDWDDAACLEVGDKKLVVSCDGPYEKRLVMKSALIHAATDVIVKGARPLFALDSLGGPKKDVKEMAESLKRQGMEMDIPIVGGNTKLDGPPIASIFVVGELLLDEPIRDSGGKKGDTLLLLGEPIWGEQEERFAKAKRLFECWYALLDEGIKINAAKDVTKGGLKNTAKEIADHSGTGFELNDLKLHMTRNLDNFLLAVDSKNAERIMSYTTRLGPSFQVNSSREMKGRENSKEFSLAYASLTAGRLI